MRRREFIGGIAGAMTLSPRHGLAQPQGAAVLKRLGVVLLGGAYTDGVEGLREGLQAEGIYVGRQVDLLVRDTNGDIAMAEAAARTLEREDAADAIVTISTSVTRAAKRGTSRLPIVFAVGSDPVEAGLVESLARPGGRLTGIHFLATDLTAKRLEILREAFPEIRRLAAFYDPRNPSASGALRLLREAARRLQMHVAAAKVRSADDIRAQALNLPGAAEAYFFLSDGMVASQADIIIERANALRLPTMGLELSLVRRGATIGYGPDYRDYGRGPVKHVTKVLAGISPSDLPVERLTIPRLSINLKVARAIGLNIPETLLARADEVIE